MSGRGPVLEQVQASGCFTIIVDVRTARGAGVIDIAAVAGARALVALAALGGAVAAGVVGVVGIGATVAAARGITGVPEPMAPPSRSMVPVPGICSLGVRTVLAVPAASAKGALAPRHRARLNESRCGCLMARLRIRSACIGTLDAKVGAETATDGVLSHWSSRDCARPAWPRRAPGRRG